MSARASVAPVDPSSAGNRASSVRGQGASSRYQVLEELASGGMGVVYRVFDNATGEIRALKRLHAEVGSRDLTVRALEREYHVLASLRHPRIIRVFDYGVDEIGPYYSMELVEGEDLREAAPVGYRQACLYLRDVATSLALLHARNLIHRDVSPRNVRRTGDGHCKLLDFGALASFGPSAVVVGTPPAVAPEAFYREPLDQRADLYSLGALAYWLLTSRQAFPARNLGDLPALWTRSPLPPSKYCNDVPPELDSLVMSLLTADPLARPASAAEVIARLNVIGELPPEDATEADLLAQSFLINPRFTGRTRELDDFAKLLRSALEGHGAAVCIQAMPGVGRTRLLDEISVLAEVTGGTVLRVDASMYRQLHGTTRALALRLLDAAPDLARDASAAHRKALAALGPEVGSRLDDRTARPSNPPASRPQAGKTEHRTTSLEAWFTDVSIDKPLVIEIDNVDEADRGSLGLLSALARVSRENRVLLVVSERLGREERPNPGLEALHGHTEIRTLSSFTDSETLDLTRSLFGDAPNVHRFADWLHKRTAGSPLHAIETCRQLIAKQVIRYEGGVWTLPMSRPDADLPAALGDALLLRIAALSEPARLLAECLSLQRQQPTLKLCERVMKPRSALEVQEILAELSRNDVLHPDRDGYRFSSSALQDALLSGMEDVREDQNHRRLGEAFASLAGDDDAALRIQAGYHLIKGGDESRGAELIADVARESATVRTLMANLHRVGEQLEAALHVYRRQRRSIYEIMPLLAALAQAGYYEDRIWGERYGDEALYVLEDISGLRAARRLRKYCGRFLSLALGILFAVVRFRTTNRRERNFSFGQIVVHLMTTVTTLAGAASLSLDAERATRVADALEPFSFLPDKLTPVGIYQFCRSLQEIGRDNEAEAYEIFDLLRRRFEDPRYYPTLPDDARRLYVAGTHFARGTFAIFRADGKGALESADALDATGLQLYAMIASQLRFLYYVNRGELAKAEPHRQQVELNAVQVGSVWQVETWESPALILVYTLLKDVVSATRVVHRLELMSRTVPSLRRYSRLAKQALTLARGESAAYTAAVAPEYGAHEPRSYIGWAATMAYLAQGYNVQRRFLEAKELCERTMVHVTDKDRDYTSLFLNLDLQLAVADAGLGKVEAALARLEMLLKRFADADHPLLHGLLHEARARIAWEAGKIEEYEQSLTEAARWLRPTGTPILIAKCEQLERFRSLNPERDESRPFSRVSSTTMAMSLPEEDFGETELLTEATSADDSRIVSTSFRGDD